MILPDGYTEYWGNSNGYGHEALAYMLARDGDTGAAIPALDYLLTLLDPTVAWQREMASRVEMLRAKLLADPNEAAEKLATWESESIHNLGLEEFRSQSTS